MVSAEAQFDGFVAARSRSLLRSAFLLTGDWATAQDLVQTALVKTWQRWDRLERQDAPEAYVVRVMTSTFLSWRRRRWHGEHAVALLPDVSLQDHADQAALRDDVARALRCLPPRQRAVIVLRFLLDLSESQTAAALGCAPGTVKSQTSKALATLRASTALSTILEEWPA